MIKKIIKNQLGDTIVEVLISIAIVSVVITGAYVIATRSLREGITASEHTQAIKLAQGQLEALKFRQQLAPKKDFLNTFAAQNGGPVNYCLNIVSTGPTTSNWGALTNASTSTLQTGSGHYNASCLDSKYRKYYMNINVTSTNVAGGVSIVFWVTVRWNAIGGGQDQSQLYYRF